MEIRIFVAIEIEYISALIQCHALCNTSDNLWTGIAWYTVFVFTATVDIYHKLWWTNCAVVSVFDCTLN